VKALCDGLIHSQPELVSSLAALESIEEEEGSSAHTSILTLLGYCKGTRHKNTNKMANKKKRMYPLVAAHTDVGVITMLLFDGGDCAALERKDDVSGSGIHSDSADHVSWAKVLLPSTVSADPIFVVNIGDCLSDLTHGYLPSTLHRVVTDRGSVPRNCLALFVGLDPNQTLTLPGGDTMTYEEWRKRRIAKAQSVLRGHGADTV
jgi:isopenicillin N synthase-like dioxygenase